MYFHKYFAKFKYIWLKKFLLGKEVACWNLTGNRTSWHFSILRLSTFNPKRAIAGWNVWGIDFWLEAKVINKISSHSWYARNYDLFSWEWSKKDQNGRLKKPMFFKIANSQHLLWKFWGLVLWLVGLMRRALINLYGCEVVQYKLKNDLKTQKRHFLLILDLMSDSLTTV